MRLGSETGSVVNHIYARATRGQPEAVVGMGCTLLCWTDRHAGTIELVTRYRSETLIEVRQDRAARTDRNGFSESQTWEFERNPNGRKYIFVLRDGRWQELVENPKSGRLIRTKGGHGLRLGHRDEYQDPCF